MFLCFEVTQPSTGTVEDHETNPIVHIKHPEETHGAWGIIAHMSGPTNGGVSYVPGMGYHSGFDHWTVENRSGMAGYCYTDFCMKIYTMVHRLFAETNKKSLLSIKI